LGGNRVTHRPAEAAPAHLDGQAEERPRGGPEQDAQAQAPLDTPRLPAPQELLPEGGVGLPKHPRVILRAIGRHYPGVSHAAPDQGAYDGHTQEATTPEPRKG